MNQQDMRKLVDTLTAHHIHDLIDGQAYQEVYAAKWVARANITQLDDLVDLLLNPADRENDDDDIYWIGMLLGEWTIKDHERVIPKIGPLLEDPHGRSTVLNAFAFSTDEARIHWLRPLASHVERLSEDEATDLIHAIGQTDTVYLSEERVNLLKQVRATFPKDNAVVQDQIAHFLLRDPASADDKE